MALRFLTALPVYNEVQHVTTVLDEVIRYSREVLVVDDGSSDGTGELLRQRDDIRLLTHERNGGYGCALQSAFTYAIEHDFDILVTVDCDGQHQPRMIPKFVEACHGVDIVSGSRYLKQFEGDSAPPEERRKINAQITDMINGRLGLSLTDAFCGFKAYRTPALARLRITNPGYAMPLQLWVQAAHLGMRISELPVPLIYLDEKRSFGGSLDNSATRLAYYHEVIDQSLATVAEDVVRPPVHSLCPGSLG